MRRPIRRPPLDWVGGVSRDDYTPEMVRKLVCPPELGLGSNGAAAAYVLDSFRFGEGVESADVFEFEEPLD